MRKILLAAVAMIAIFAVTSFPQTTLTGKPGKVKVTLTMFTPTGEIKVEQPEELVPSPTGSCVAYTTGDVHGLFCGTYQITIKGKLTPQIPAAPETEE